MKSARPSQCAPLPDNAPHVLVVDDDQKIRDLLGRYLTEHGFRVTTASDAASARAGMRGLEFDVVLLDVMMPGENGLELARDLKATRPIPICMLTARSDPEQRIEGLEAGVDDYIPKPFEPRELLLRLRNILRRAAGPTGPHDEIRMGAYVFHVGRGELRHGDETIKLTERERDLLRAFAQRIGTPIAAPRALERRFDRQRPRHRRADQPAAAQDRDRPLQSGVPPDSARQRVYSLFGLNTRPARHEVRL